MSVLAELWIKFSDDIESKKVIDKLLTFVHPEALATRVSQLDNIANDFKNGKYPLTAYFFGGIRKLINTFKRMIGGKR